MLKHRTEIFKSGIGSKLVVYMVFFSSFITLLSTAVQLTWDYDKDIEQIQSQLQLIQDVHVESLTISMWISDKEQLNAHLDGIALLRDMKFIELRDESKVWISRGNRQEREVISRRYPLVYSHKGKDFNIGTLIAQASLRDVYQRLIDKVWIILITNGIKIFLVAGFMLILFYMLSTRHIIRISEFVHDLDVEKDNQKLKLERQDSIGQKKDELNLVVDAINEMQRKVKESFLVLRQTEDVWQSLAASTTPLQFDAFMDEVLDRLTTIYSCKYGLIGHLSPDGKYIQTLAVWKNGKRVDDFKYDLLGTPCQDILDNNTEFVPREASKIYSDNEMLMSMGIESFLGSQLVNSKGKSVGVLAVLDNKPMQLERWVEPVLGVFAKRLSLELERNVIDQELKKYHEHLEEMVQERTKTMEVALSEAERANTAKSEFLSRMSHELRTPMNAILGFAQLLHLDEDDLNELQLSNVNEILEAGQHLLALINEVLDLAKIESGKFEVSMETVSIDEQLQQCLAMIQAQADSCGLKVIDNISGKGQIIKADTSRFKQVLLNLLSNAVKYNCCQGSITLTSEELSEHKVRICVTDTGVGLKEEEVKRLFRPFERMESANSVEGTGIGLVISKHLVELMGGSIGVESVYEKGSTFWIDLNLV